MIDNITTTDESKMEDEAVVMMYCKKDDFMNKIRSCSRYLSVSNPKIANADGLLRCLGEVLKQTMGM